MECGIVESPLGIPWDPITSSPSAHPYIRRVQVPRLTWAKVVLAVGGRDSGAVVSTDVTEKFHTGKRL